MSTQFHITIGSSPDPTKGSLLLAAELRMTKAALLYADNVKLCSVMASSLVTSWDEAKSSIGKWADFMITLLSLGTHSAVDHAELLNSLVRFRQLHGFVA